MEDCKEKRKRVSCDEDSEADSPESKALRVDSSDSKLVRVGSGVDSSESQLTRVNSGDSCLNSEDSTHDSSCDIQGDLLNILDDSFIDPERDSAMQGLDSVIKSFEEEILAAGSDPGQNPEPESGELQPNLGYLLEASDDELGLPPSTVATESKTDEPGRVVSEGADLASFMGFEDDDVFGLEAGFTAESGGDDVAAGSFMASDGLFEYSDPADILWRSESLQAM
ncbi:hypothetical protein PIB30_052914 [Stylosanthes scabra]|uniref:Uncharacterized protein n=1 Tax=Stylosanthes scabra TaxID=79078 RepID=A0ABU6UKD1_9FABA|nr:hypothetical protein [Stylosanthes scabra]